MVRPLFITQEVAAAAAAALAATTELQEAKVAEDEVEIIMILLAQLEMV